MTQSLQEKILNIIILITGTIFIIMVIWYILGNSPTTDQLLLGLGAVIFESLFSIHSRLGSIESTFKNYNSEINSIKSDVAMLKADNIVIKHKFKI